MTSTSFNVGLNTATRNSSKVLKPPGGGSSDIFGASSEVAEPQRKVRNHLTSSIFTEDTVTPARNKAGNDSFYNLFGSESQVRPVSAFTDRKKSNIVLNDLSTNIVPDAKKNLTFLEDLVTPAKDSCTDIVCQDNGDTGDCNGIHNTNGSDCDIHEDNPLTDSPTSTLHLSSCVSTKLTDVEAPKAPEAPAVNGVASSASSVASTPAPTPTAPSASASKQRVPPGGFSSGLW